jgi:hypothetical protein
VPRDAQIRAKGRYYLNTCKHPHCPSKKEIEEYTKQNLTILCMSIWQKHVIGLNLKANNKPKKCDECMATREFCVCQEQIMKSHWYFIFLSFHQKEAASYIIY